jgi:hypothetical protein
VYVCNIYIYAHTTSIYINYINIPSKKKKNDNKQQRLVTTYLAGEPGMGVFVIQAKISAETSGAL